jgi:hypothetical protein
MRCLGEQGPGYGADESGCRLAGEKYGADPAECRVGDFALNGGLRYHQ